MKLSISLLILGFPFVVSAQIYKCPDAKGRPVYSNISCDPGQRPIPMTNPGSAAAGNSAYSVMQLMDSAVKEKDPEKRFNLVQSVRMAVAAYKAQATAEAIAKSEVTAGVPVLAQQLKDAQLRDRASPEWPQYQSDSPITSNIRQQLNVAREHAVRLTPNVLATNADYARVMARFSGFEN